MANEKEKISNEYLDRLAKLMSSHGYGSLISSAGDNTWLDKMLKCGIIKTANGKSFNFELKTDAEREEFAKRLTASGHFYAADNNSGSYIRLDRNGDGTYNESKVNVPQQPIRPLFILMFLAYCGFKIAAVEAYYKAKHEYDSNEAKDYIGDAEAKRHINELKKDIADYARDKATPELYRLQKLKDAQAIQRKLQNQKKALTKKRASLEKQTEKLAQKQEQINRDKRVENPSPRQLRRLKRRQNRLDELGEKIARGFEKLNIDSQALLEHEQLNNRILKYYSKPIEQKKQAEQEQPEAQSEVKPESPEVKPEPPEVKQEPPEVKPEQPENEAIKSEKNNDIHDDVGDKVDINSPLSVLNEAEVSRADDKPVNDSVEQNKYGFLGKSGAEALSEQKKRLSVMLNEVDKNSPLGLACATAIDNINRMFDISDTKPENSEEQKQALTNAVAALALFGKMKQLSENKEKEALLGLTKAVNSPDFAGSFTDGLNQFSNGVLKKILDGKSVEQIIAMICDNKSVEALGSKALSQIKKDKSLLIKADSIVFGNIYKEPDKNTWSPMPNARIEDVTQSLSELKRLDKNDRIFAEADRAEQSYNLNPQKRSIQTSAVVQKLNEVIKTHNTTQDPLIKKASIVAIREIKHLLNVGMPDNPSSPKYAQQLESLNQAAGCLMGFQSLINDKNGTIHMALGTDEKRFEKFINTGINNKALIDMCSFRKDDVISCLCEADENGGIISLVSHEAAERERLGIPQTAQRCGYLFRLNANENWLEVKGASQSEINSSLMQLMGNSHTRSFVLTAPEHQIANPVFDIHN